jgi:hypothetical protein
VKYKIEKDWERIGLHDSHLSEIVLDHKTIFLKLDWGFLDNFNERDLLESIVFGRAELTLFEVRSQRFRQFTDDGMTPIEFSSELLARETWLVMTNECKLSDNSIELIITMTNDFRLYLEWTIEFKHGQLEWDDFIMHKNWLNGTESLPINSAV